jgi:hypothetical protein
VLGNRGALTGPGQSHGFRGAFSAFRRPYRQVEPQLRERQNPYGLTEHKDRYVVLAGVGCYAACMPELAVSTHQAGSRFPRSSPAPAIAPPGFLEFFTVNIRNGNTRAAYADARAAAAFLRWCDARHASAAGRAARACRGLYRAAAGRALRADRQAASGW